MDSGAKWYEHMRGMTRITPSTFLSAVDPGVECITVHVRAAGAFSMPIYATYGAGPGKSVKDLQMFFSEHINDQCRLELEGAASTYPEAPIENGQIYNAVKCAAGREEWYNNWANFSVLLPNQKRNLCTTAISRDWFNYDEFNDFATFVYDVSCQTAVVENNEVLSQQCFEEVLLANLFHQLQLSASQTLGAQPADAGPLLGLNPVSSRNSTVSRTYLDHLYDATDFLTAQGQNKELKVVYPTYANDSTQKASNVIAQLQCDSPLKRYECMVYTPPPALQPTILKLQQAGVILDNDYEWLSDEQAVQKLIVKQRKKVFSEQLGSPKPFQFALASQTIVDQAIGNGTNTKTKEICLNACADYHDYTALFTMFPFLFEGNAPDSQRTVAYGEKVTCIHSIDDGIPDCVLELHGDGTLFYWVGDNCAQIECANPSEVLKTCVKELATLKDVGYQYADVRIVCLTKKKKFTDIFKSRQTASQVLSQRNTTTQAFSGLLAGFENFLNSSLW